MLWGLRCSSAAVWWLGCNVKVATTVCRYKTATAGVSAKEGGSASAGGGGGDDVELSRRARSLTRSLARAGTPSPLVQLLAKHRQRRYCPTAPRRGL